MLNIPVALTLYICVAVALLGAALGSFLFCWAWRWRRGEPVSRGRSHCDLCGHTLRARDLVPVISYVLARGRCRYCGGRLSLRHLLAEMAGAIAFVSLFLRYGFTLRTLQMLMFATVLLGASLTDLEGMVIPDRLILLGLISGLGFPFLQPQPWRALSAAMLGGLGVAGAVLLVVLALENLWKKEAMGGGDIKLLLVTGLHLGLSGNLLCLLLACIFGIILGLAAGKRQQPLAWAPAIALAAWVTALWGEALVAVYLSLF